jgi:hypothetical protein
MLYKWKLIVVGTSCPLPAFACVPQVRARFLGATLGAAEVDEVVVIYFRHPESLMKVNQHRITRRILYRVHGQRNKLRRRE